MTRFSSVERLEGRVLLHALDVAGAIDVDAVAADDAAPFHLRLNAGGRTYVDSSGYTWERDRIGRGGRKGRRVYDVGGTGEEPLFATYRTGKLIRYTIPLPAPGVYGVNLLFAD